MRGLFIALLLLSAGPRDFAAPADPLTLYEIQSNTSDGDASVYDWQVVDCTGGIVVTKFWGYKARVILQDPAHPNGWGAIQVKDWTNNNLYNQVELGDWVELTNMEVEEFNGGGTFLQWLTMHNPGFRVVSQGNPVPQPTLVTVRDIAAPLYDSAEDAWFVEDYDAEPYESMHLVIRNVTVTRRNLGKASDNYNLQSPAGNDCWAADYMNEEVEPSGYHPFVDVGQHFCAVTGLLEHYKKLSAGWDYYQLITRRSIDLAICGDGDSDADVDLDDLPRFRECLIGPRCDGTDGGCNPPAWTAPDPGLLLRRCLAMDLDYDGDVDLADFAGLQRIMATPGE